VGLDGLFVGSVVVGIFVCAKSRWGLGGEEGGIDAGEEFWSLEKTRSVEMRCMGDLEEGFESKNGAKR
jgi:hypothetical protein